MVVSHYCFNLYFPDDLWGRASSSVRHLLRPLLYFLTGFFAFLLLGFVFGFCLFRAAPIAGPKVPRLGVESELQLLAYITGAARQDPSHVCDLHHGQGYPLSPLLFNYWVWQQGSGRRPRKSSVNEMLSIDTRPQWNEVWKAVEEMEPGNTDGISRHLLVKVKKMHISRGLEGRVQGEISCHLY